MKKNIFILLVLGWITFSFSQTVVNINDVKKVKEAGIEKVYLNDTPFTGVLTEYFKNGKPKIWITMSEGLANGLWQEWLENGNLRFNAYWKAGKGHGLWQYFHDNGTLKYEEAYIEDIPNGISRSYYNNGTLENDYFWLLGKKHGVWSYYSETGILLKQEVYENGELISTTEDKK